MLKSKPRQKRLSTRTVLHILTGSIAAYKAPSLIKKLRDAGARVVCVMTHCAKEFVTPTVLRTVSGERVYSEMFPQDAPYGVLHTSLADLPDLVLVSPATANFIAKMATGISDDLPSCLVLATRTGHERQYVCPSDHSEEHRPTQSDRLSFCRSRRG